MIYFDYAATSYPKPVEVIKAMTEALEHSANPGRSAHDLAVATARQIFTARRVIASHIHASGPKTISFTKNCTEALNIALFGALSPGDHVITTCFEHNSILRPLHALQDRGVELTIVEPSEDVLTPQDILRHVQPHTTMVALSHVENLTGMEVDIETLGRALPENILFLVDGAQSLGTHEIDVEQCHIDLLAAPGHKGLLGPMGTGFLYVRNERMITPFMVGGTGSKSQSLQHPDFAPDKFEAGTPNAPGIIGLMEGIRVLERRGVKASGEKIHHLTQLFYEGVKDVEGVRIYGPRDSSDLTSIVSLTIDGMDSSQVSDILDSEFSIATRPQLHCAPLAHLYYKTIETGMVRFSFGYDTTEDEIQQGIEAIQSIANRLKK